MKNISVLGSTGSIGRQTLEVAAANPEQLKIRVLAAHRNVDLMLQQIELYHHFKRAGRFACCRNV